MRPAPKAPCAHCPAGVACPAISKRIGRYCEILDPSEPDHNPRHAADMAAMLRGEPHPAYARSGQSPPAGPARPSPASPARDPFSPVILARACEYSAGRPPDCGCADQAVCLAGRGWLGPDRRAVYLRECVDCELGGPAHEFA